LPFTLLFLFALSRQHATHCREKQRNNHTKPKGEYKLMCSIIPNQQVDLQWGMGLDESKNYLCLWKNEENEGMKIISVKTASKTAMKVVGPCNQEIALSWSTFKPSMCNNVIEEYLQTKFKAKKKDFDYLAIASMYTFIFSILSYLLYIHTITIQYICQ
jgi:hypothetical protein